MLIKHSGGNSMEKCLLALFLFGINFTVLSEPIAGSKSVVPILYFLNTPETVRTTGILAEESVSAGTECRVFFHYKNGTSHLQKFSISSSETWNNTHSGVFTSQSPGDAGATAAENFLKSKSINSGLSYSYCLKSGEVISGIIDGFPVSNGRFSCSLGAGSAIKDRKITKISNVFMTHSFDFHPGDGIISVGVSPDKKVLGNYGTTEKIIGTSIFQYPVLLTVSAIACSGNIQIVYSRNGEVYKTPFVRIHKQLKLWTQTLYPNGVVSLETIPIGGYCYPLKFKFSIRRM